MTLKYRTEGFVFKKEAKLEADQTFSVFTKDFGRVELKARAVRKITSKLRSDIDIFYFSEIEFIQGKLGKTLTDANKIKRNAGVIDNLNKLKIAYQVACLLDYFIKGQEKDIATFNLLAEFFDNLQNNLLKINNHQLVYQYFFWNFLSLQGYCLQAQNCACCQKELDPYSIYFSSKEGGVICSACAEARKSEKYETVLKINSDVTKVLRLILNKDWDTILKVRIEPQSQKILESISENAIRTFCPAHC